MSQKKELDTVRWAIILELKELRKIERETRRKISVAQSRLFDCKLARAELDIQREAEVAKLFVEEVRGCISDSLHDFCMQEAIKKYEQESEDGLDRTGL